MEGRDSALHAPPTDACAGERGLTLNHETPDGRGHHAPPWLFAITNLPFGVSGGYAAVAMPFMLRNAGLDLETIAKIGALALLPAAYQLFWAPILDLGMRRRAWLIVVSVIGGLCLGASVLLDLPRQLPLYELLMVTGQLFVGLVASCNGALVSTSLPNRLHGQAAGWVNAGNLGSAALGGGLIMSLAGRGSPHVTALVLTLLIIVPSFAALLIPEPPPHRERLADHVGRMARDVWRAVKARKGWTGLLFCISPVGTAALGNLFSALGPDYGVSDQVVEWVNGYGGGFVTAAGALVSGYFIDRVDRRMAYVASGCLTAICGIGMALAPLTPTAFIVGCLAYLLVTGLCYAAFSAVVYEIVEGAGSTASTLYSVFPAAGNQAIAYTLFFDGLAHKRWGTRGVLATDAVLNLLGVMALLVLLRLVFRDRGQAEEGQVPPLECAEPETAPLHAP